VVLDAIFSVIAVVGYILIKVMALLRRRLLVWHQEALEPTTV